MKNRYFLWAFVLVFPVLFIQQTAAQSTLEGYIFEANNRGYLNQAKVTIFDLATDVLRGETMSDVHGHFSFVLPAGAYRLHAFKDIFFEKTDTVTVGKEKTFLKLEMRRRPGYLFDATIAEVRESPDQVVDAITGATIEIYNRTTGKSELTIREDDDAFFNYTFERGNHYSLLIRKEGYLTKRIEVYVNVNGCIICVDGVRDVAPDVAVSAAPGIVDVLAAGLAEGTLLANIELDRARIDKRIQIQNIYYDFDKWDIRPDAAERLDNVVTLMNDNPGISVELGSHTDSRGDDEYNRNLSARRAASAVAYIVSQGVDSMRITSRGYGESQLVNRCSNGVACSEDDHQQNRRTELRITGINSKTNWKSLPEIIEAEEMEAVKKGKNPRARRPQQALPEANNSIKLPELQAAPDDLAARGQTSQAPNERNNSETRTARPRPIASEDAEGARIFPLPTNFKGCAVELTRNNTELPANAPALRGQKEVFRLLENDGQFSYLLVNLGSKEQALAYFKKKIKPVNSSARLVFFSEAGKQYID